MQNDLPPADSGDNDPSAAAGPLDRSNLASTMVMFEMFLGLVAVAIGAALGHRPWIGMFSADADASYQLQAMGWGVLAAIPMLLVVLSAYRWPLGPLRSVRRVSERQIAPLFQSLSIWEKAAVSLAAGLGEELMFRGLLQAGLAAAIGGQAGLWIGLAVASVVFGVCHWLNRTYAVLATAMGVYFGWLLIATGNLWTPIVAHAVYDFVAIVVLIRLSGHRRRNRTEAPSDGS